MAPISPVKLHELARRTRSKRDPKPAARVTVPVAGSDAAFPVRRIYCVGRNYAAHAREMGFDPDRDPPFFFCKPDNSLVIVPPGQTVDVAYPPQTGDNHHEIELVVAIGKAGHDIPAERAHEHVRERARTHM